MPILSWKLVMAANNEPKPYAVGWTVAGGNKYPIVLKGRGGGLWDIKKHILTPGADMQPYGLVRRGAVWMIVGKTSAASAPTTLPTQPTHYAPLSVSLDAGDTWSVVWVPFTTPIISQSAIGAQNPSVAIQAIAAGEESFVATALISVSDWTDPLAIVGQYIAVSSDGLSWSTASHADLHPGQISTAAMGVNAVSYAKEKFVAAAGDTLTQSIIMMVSTDGASWSNVANESPGSTSPKNPVYSKGFGFLCVHRYGAASLGALRSEDGLAWTDLGDKGRSAPAGVVYRSAKRRFVVDHGGSTSISDDGGDTWSAGGSIGIANARIDQVGSWIYASGVGAIRRSRDGVNWTATTLPALPSGHTWGGFAGIA